MGNYWTRETLEILLEDFAKKTKNIFYVNGAERL